MPNFTFTSFPGQQQPTIWQQILQQIGMRAANAIRPTAQLPAPAQVQTQMPQLPANPLPQMQMPQPATNPFATPLLAPPPHIQMPQPPTNPLPQQMPQPATNPFVNNRIDIKGLLSNILSPQNAPTQTQMNTYFPRPVNEQKELGLPAIIPLNQYADVVQNQGKLKMDLLKKQQDNEQSFISDLMKMGQMDISKIIAISTNPRWDEKEKADQLSKYQQSIGVDENMVKIAIELGNSYGIPENKVLELVKQRFSSFFNAPSEKQKEQPIQKVKLDKWYPANSLDLADKEIKEKNLDAHTKSIPTVLGNKVYIIPNGMSIAQQKEFDSDINILEDVLNKKATLSQQASYHAQEIGIKLKELGISTEKLGIQQQHLKLENDKEQRDAAKYLADIKAHENDKTQKGITAIINAEQKLAGLLNSKITKIKKSLEDTPEKIAGGNKTIAGIPVPFTHVDKTNESYTELKNKLTDAQNTYDKIINNINEQILNMGGTPPISEQENLNAGQSMNGSTKKTKKDSSHFPHQDSTSTTPQLDPELMKAWKKGMGK